ncbi:hypothetical protein Len3610_12470 [Lentibacillus sp. CBA3610]|nr:hypothetical protein Len3610_12470 [Lentibacillus sp. CBA3610]
MSLLCTSTVTYADNSQTFGPEEWSEYRLNSYNNPVYNSNFSEQIKTALKSGDEIRSTPVIINNTAYIGNHNSGEIFAYDIKTKELKWKNKAPNWIHSEIIFAKNQLFVGYGNRFMKNDEIRGTEESGLLSLDPETGEILWNFETKGEVMPTPAYYKDTVYITTGDRHLYGVNPLSGKEEWSLKLNGVVSMSAPNIHNGVLYVGSALPSSFQAVDLENKEVLWKKEFPDIDKGIDDVPPVVLGDLVFTTGVTKSSKDVPLRQTYESDGLLETYKAGVKKSIGNLINKPPEKLHNHKVFAMDINTGEVVWETSLGEGEMVPNNKSGAPMIYDGKVFVGSPITKGFYALNAKTGETLWNKEANINKAPPVADNNIVYFTDTKGLVYAFDTESGELKGKKLLGGKLAPSGPILMNDHLIVGSQDSNAYILPTTEILQSNDSIDSEEKNASDFLFVMLVYIVPILIVLGIMAVVFLGVRKLRAK